MQAHRAATSKRVAIGIVLAVIFGTLGILANGTPGRVEKVEDSRVLFSIRYDQPATPGTVDIVKFSCPLDHLTQPGEKPQDAMKLMEELRMLGINTLAWGPGSTRAERDVDELIVANLDDKGVALLSSLAPELLDCT